MSRVRSATPGDAAVMHELAAGLGYTPVSAKQFLDNMDALLGSEKDRLWLCEDGPKVNGWLHAFRATRPASLPFVEIGAMVVRPGSRRAGNGRLLVEQAKAWADALQLRLRVRCHSEREETHRFYEAVGFRLAKRQNIYELHNCQAPE